MGKVRFGIESVYYATQSTAGKWDTPKALKGATELSLDAEGSSDKFYADDTTYAVFTTNDGYTGTLTVAAIEDDARADLLNELKDTKGGVYETSDAVPPSVALMFKVRGNETDQNFVFYNVTFSRPSIAANTTSDSTDPDTVELSITCIPQEMTIGSETKKVTKFCMERNDTTKEVFDKWFTEVQTPTVASA